jgi:SAM-dependent methyltransferase
MRRSIIEKFYPEVGAGGFTSIDGTLQFFTRVNALLHPDMTVVDYGAGRAEFMEEDPIEYRRKIRTFRGKVKHVIGIDVADAVMSNPVVDQAYVVQPGSRLPLDDRSVDMVISDHVFEHFESPAEPVAEIERILKPGGWLCARTPNKWSYSAIGAALIPNKFHALVLSRLQPARKEIDIFPTFFRMNTRADFARYFDPSRWDVWAYTWNPEPAYVGNSQIGWWAVRMAFRFLPSSLGTTWLVFARRK